MQLPRPLLPWKVHTGGCSNPPVLSLLLALHGHHAGIIRLAAHDQRPLVSQAVPLLLLLQPVLHLLRQSCLQGWKNAATA
jgi:hypothetical protein